MMDDTLFPVDPVPETAPADQPLAERMRPRNLDEVLGQEHLLAEGKILREVISSDEIPSMIFWGPPGAGKTTLARIIAAETESHFVSISAVLSGIRDVRRIVEEARTRRRTRNRSTILFVDEIHRFNKAQQDAFLPHVERATLVLIGATTENPSFEVIAPLLSRSRVLVLNALEEEHLRLLLQRAMEDEERGLAGLGLQIDPEAMDQMVRFADGDARKALNSLEVAASLARRSAHPRITPDIAKEALQHKTLLYDRAGEEHFNIISALHKSLRNSDVDASLYWLARMLEAGEDPLYIARRMVRFASEDVGAADPRALSQAIDAMKAVDFIGLPEGKLALAQLAVYLAQAPKSNAVYRAYAAAQRDVEETRNEPVPLHLRNAPTGMMKDLGCGRGYRYAHDEEEAVSDMDCLPPGLAGRRYYHPGGEGREREIAGRLKEIRRRRKRAAGERRRPEPGPEPK